MKGTYLQMAAEDSELKYVIVINAETINLKNKTMENKLTAVEWFAEQIVDLSTQLMDKKITQLDFANGLIESEEQAKQMEKKQSKSDFIAGMEFIPVDPNRYEEDSEQYYNETYGKGE